MSQSAVISLLPVMLALSGIGLTTRDATAQTVYGIVQLTNETAQTFMIPSSGVSLSGGQFSTAGLPMNNNPANEGVTAGGAPAGIIGPGQTIIFESESNGGLLGTGTGGTITIPNVSGSMYWNVPWGNFHGIPTEYCDGHVNSGSGGFVAGIYDPTSGGPTTEGANSCSFSYGIVNPDGSRSTLSAIVNGSLIGGQALARGTAQNTATSSDGRWQLVLQNDGNLVLWDQGMVPANPLWWTGASSAVDALMQGDGNFVLYDVNGHALWATQTYSHPNAYLTIDDSAGLDYGLIVHDSGGSPLWIARPSGTKTIANARLMTGGKCIDLPNWNTANGTLLEIWDCNGGSNQQWTVESDGTIRSAVNNNKCIDLPNWQTANQTPLEIWDCNGGSNQQWSYNNNNTITGFGAKCVDLPHGNTTNGTQIQYYQCNGGWNQQWASP